MFSKTEGVKALSHDEESGVEEITHTLERSRIEEVEG